MSQRIKMSAQTRSDEMTVPSRCMPSYQETIGWGSKIFGLLVLSGIVWALGYLAWTEPDFRIFLFASAAVVLVSFWDRSQIESLERVRAERKDEDIGSFARALDYRRVDPWIIRAVYEEINEELPLKEPLPLRPSDHLERDLKLDGEDLEFVLERIFSRVGLSDENIEKNPFYGKIETVRDLVEFCNGQPCDIQKRFSLLGKADGCFLNNSDDYE